GSVRYHRSFRMSRSLKTFSITTLGCRVNRYESEQLATLLRQRGLTQSYQDDADLRIVHTCSVTIQAASKSRQTVRRATRLPIFTSAVLAPSDLAGQGSTNPEPQNRSDAKRPKVIVTGCWATSDAEQASAIPGVDAVLGHHHDVNAELNHLLTQWGVAEGDSFPTSLDHNRPISPKPGLNEIKMIKK